MPKRLIITVVCFHITAAMLLGFAILAFAMFGPLGLFGGLVNEMTRQMPQTGPAMPEFFRTILGVMTAYIGLVGLALVASAIGVEIVVWGLRKLDYWAWIAGIVICGLLIVSGFSGLILHLALGGLGLWGLVDPDSVKAFKPDGSSSFRTDG